MTLLSDFECERLLNHIKSSGLLDGFTDHKGNAQPAMPSTANIIDMTALDANSRALQVRLSGNDQFASGSIGMSQYPCSVYIFGKAQLSDTNIVNSFTSALKDWLRVNYTNNDECIISIQTLGKGGPFILSDNRPYFEIPLIVRFNEISG